MGQLRASGKDVEHEAPAEKAKETLSLLTLAVIDNAMAESVNMI
jgi:ribosomal protein S12 methylthiotransferase